MTIEEILQAISSARPALPETGILDLIVYKWNGAEDWGSGDDLNADVRAAVSKALYRIYDAGYRQIIRVLLRAEMDYCSEETMMTGVLRRLCFMLYEIGEPEDLALLHEAKFGTSFDASCALDPELIRGRDPDRGLEYYKANPLPEADIAADLEAYNKPDSGLLSPEDYSGLMRKRYAKEDDLTDPG